MSNRVDDALELADENWRKCECLDCETQHVLAAELRAYRAALTAEEREHLLRIRRYFDQVSWATWNDEARAVLDKLLALHTPDGASHD